MKRSWLVVLATLLASCSSAAGELATLPSGDLASRVVTATTGELEDPTATPAATPAVSPSIEGGPTAGDVAAGRDEPIVVFHQEGGFAGLELSWSIYADGRIVNESGQSWQVAPEKVTGLLDSIEQTGFFELEQAKSEPICCDFFTYSLTIRSPDGEKTLTYSEGDPALPPAFSQAVSAVQMLLAKLAR